MAVTPPTSAADALDADALRAGFPLLARVVYLQAGTCGPVPAAAVAAAGDVLQRMLDEERGNAYYGGLAELRECQRAGYAALLGADAADVALTTCTSEGIVRVLATFPFGPGDEVLTAVGEHPGLSGPLGTLRRRGVHVRAVPLETIADAVGPATKLIACSHVSWSTGALCPSLHGCDVPVLLDGAQSVGAVPVDVAALGCDFFAGPGQKWLCGPVGTGMLWVAPAWRKRLPELGATYFNLADPGDPERPFADARRHDAAAVSAEATAHAVAALDVLAGYDWARVQARAIALAAELAVDLERAGRPVAPRGASTLVSWEDATPDATRDRLAAAGILVRSIPETPHLRASVGAWNDRADLDRLLGELA